MACLATGEPMTLTPGQIIQRLEEIESDCAEKQQAGEVAAEAWARMNRKYELKYAQEYVKSTGSPMEKKQVALNAVGMDQEFWNEMVAAEASYEGWKAGMRSRELRTSIGQSLLRAQRERGA